MASGGLSSVLQRPHPPTPPKHLDKLFDEAIKSLDIRYPSISPPKASAVASQSTGHTDTPPPSSPLQQSSSDADPKPKSRKRLRFSAETSIIGSSLDGSADTASTPPASSGPLKAQQSSASKSILKVSEYKPREQSSPSTSQASHNISPPAGNSDTFPNMLQSVVTALAGPDPYSRRDAYSTLTNCLRTYKDFPEFDNIALRLPSLQQYLLRDMAESRELHKLPEQALNCAFLLLGRFPQAISIEFRKSIIERIVTMLEAKTETKEVAKLQLNMLTLRELYGKAMTPERAKKVLKGVTEIDKWVSGSSVVGLRMIVYRQMVQHHPNVFIEDVQSYLPPIFHGLMSSTKELRSRAMETGIVLGQMIGERQRVSKALEVLMETKSDNGLRYADFIRNQLLRMLDRAYDAEHVPQLWGVIMLILRGTPSFVKEWFHSNDWCLIIQKCFNKSDEKVNRYAWTAWNYTIFAIGPRLVEYEWICKRLVQPVIGHLQRPWNGEQVDATRQAARSTLILLLYSAFGQRSSDSDLVACWTRLVRDVCHKVIVKCPPEKAFLTETLSRLLTGPGLKIWRPERVLESGRLSATKEDVPYIDPQWQRRNVAVILQSFSIPRPGHDDGKFAHIPGASLTLWQCLVSSVSMAGEKEIQMSVDLKKAIAAMLNYLHGLTIHSLTTAGSGGKAETCRLQDLVPFMRAAIDRLGPDCFTSKIVRRNTQGDFEAPLTPSKHMHSSSSHLEAPIVSMVKILAQCSTDGGDSMKLAFSASSVMEPFLAMRGGLGALLRLLGDCAFSLRTRAEIDAHESSAYLWRAMSELAMSALQQNRETTRHEGRKFLGETYLDASRILEVGLKTSDTKSWHCFTSLYDTTSRCIKEDAGDAGYSLGLTGPLVQTMAKSDAALKVTTLLRFLTLTLNEGSPAPNDRGLEQAARALGEHFISTLSGGPFEWLSSLCSLLSVAWSTAYAELATVDHASLDAFLRTFAGLYNTLPVLEPRMGASWALPLVEVRDGLCKWLDDAEGRIKRYSGRGYNFAKAIDDIWCRHLKVVCRKRFREQYHDSFEAYLIAGLRSHQTSTANRAVTAWNDLIDVEPDTKISGQLFRLLQQLAKHADIHLPTVTKAFEESINDGWGPQNADGDLFPWLQNSSSQTSQSLPKQEFLPSAHAHSRPHIFRSLVASTKPTPTKVSVRPNTTQRTPPPRLRHDDSQIQFVAVTSSPIQPDDQESQYLTAHQKDTRERQQVNAAMFADLRSSSPVRPRSPEVNVTAQNAQKPIAAGFDGSDDGQGYSVFRRKPAAPPKPRQAESSAEQKEVPGSGVPESSDAVRPPQTGTDTLERTVPSVQANAAPQYVSPAGTTADASDDTEPANARRDEREARLDTNVREDAANGARSKNVQGEDERSNALSDVYHDAVSSPGRTVRDASLVDSSLPDRHALDIDALRTPAEQTIASRATIGVVSEQARPSRIEDSFRKEQHVHETARDDSSPLGGQLHDATSSDDVTITKGSKEDHSAQHGEAANENSAQSQADAHVAAAANMEEAAAVATPSADASPSISGTPSQQVIDDEEAGECITVQAPDASTPPLITLLKARGALRDPSNSQSPSVQVQKRNRGRPRGLSVKRSFSTLGGEDVDSNYSSQQTPAQARAERAKRRKTDSQLSGSQASGSQVLTPQTLPKQRRRKSATSNSQETQSSPSLKRKRAKTDDGGDEDTQVVGQSQEEENLQEAQQEAVASSQPAAEDIQPRGLMARLRAMIEDVKKAWLNPDDEEEASELAYKLQREIGKAGRRFGN